MGAITAAQQPAFATGDVRLCAVSFAAQLDSGESLTGTPTVAEQTTSDLIIASVAVSSAALVINGRPVAAGSAVQFKVSGQKASGLPYKLKITATTNSSPAQTLVRYVQFVVQDT
jgi:hypothetical protein